MDYFMVNAALQSRPSQAGVSLVECAVVLGLLALLTALAVPAWQQLRSRHAIQALVTEYSQSLHFARSAAVRHRTAVTVCPSSDGLNCTDSALEQGWIVRLGETTEPGSPTLRILQDILPRALVRTRFSANALARRAITFLPNGQPQGLAINTLWVCPTDRQLGQLARNVVLNQAMRIRVDTPGRCGFE